tara:strand:+ start:22 stop:477 length:456 start_codon:yes stop_codon:yes gene_type:complete
MPDPVKKKKKVQKKPSNMPGRGGGVTKPKGKLAKKKPEQTGYGPQNRTGIAPKKRKIVRRGPQKQPKEKRPGDGARLRMISREKARKAAMKKARLAKLKAPKKKKRVMTPQRPSASKLERMINAANKKVIAGGGKPMSVSQLRKAGKIKFN